VERAPSPVRRPTDTLSHGERENTSYPPGPEATFQQMEREERAGGSNTALTRPRTSATLSHGEREKYLYSPLPLPKPREDGPG
jgi:hypothetical protein